MKSYNVECQSSNAFKHGYKLPETEKQIQFWEKPNLLPKRMEKSGNEDDFQPSSEL